MRPLNGTLFAPAFVFFRTRVPTLTKRVHLRFRPLRGATQRLPFLRPGAARAMAIRVVAAAESLNAKTLPRCTRATSGVARFATANRAGDSLKPLTVSAVRGAAGEAGAPAGLVGVTALESADAMPSPAAFDAVTVKV